MTNKEKLIDRLENYDRCVGFRIQDDKIVTHSNTKVTTVRYQKDLIESLQIYNLEYGIAQANKIPRIKNGEMKEITLVTLRPIEKLKA